MPIEARGKKDPALAAALKAGKPPVVIEWDYIVGRRPLKVGEETRQPGDPIPEAASWPRLESWLRSGAIVQIQPQVATQLEEIPGDDMPKRGRTVPVDGQRHTTKVTAPRKATRPRPVHDEEEPPARPVLRPRKGASE